MMTNLAIQDLKTDLTSNYMPYFMVARLVWGGCSWLWVRSRPTLAGKKLWHRRLSILSGILFGGLITLTLLLMRQWPALFIFVPAIALIIYLNLRFTFYCDSCEKRSCSQQWFSATHHCPHCGHKLR